MAVFSGTKQDAPREPTRNRGEAGLTIVAAGTRVVGEIQSDGVVKVEGTRVGTVHSDTQVLVSRGGVIEGDVITRDAVIGGEVRGSVIASERVEVQASSVVHGDITTERLIVAEGGEVNGKVAMGSAEPSVPNLGSGEAALGTMTE
jgi:cytoskeletal protein CcmA (bactofilin family)